ncbi:MAG TPA: D-tyrosyl-tRNA(Tyr) deacylase [Cellvibrionales bacterium]|nr:D-tyrosyl-tRNA(Tyr) deacylase [Cellvibrionales bacterium]
MRALIQRVNSASVRVDDQLIGQISKGLLVLLAIEADDDSQSVAKMAAKLLDYRVFSDHNDKMNLSVTDIVGELLIVSQFTLAANTDKGLRPSFSSAAEPALAKRLYLDCVAQLKASSLKVETGQFAADMQVALVNDGPVTFMLTI